MGSDLFMFILGVCAASWWYKRSAERERRREAYYAHFYGTHATRSAPNANTGDNQQQLRSHQPFPLPPHQGWDADRTRFMDSMVDLSEATLDTLLVTFQIMKNKLVETKARREEFLPPPTQQYVVAPQPEAAPMAPFQSAQSTVEVKATKTD
ncbi:hypothetical protein HGRIS_010514 [Hohenbuehelia grisea]|uniref:Uncharacterized protein n=1 Tax=Hohenbuehelia grisea TaxID=104357 RepID=A0ABR3IX37_9AGAR